MRYLLLYLFTASTIALAGLIYLSKIIKVMVFGPTESTMSLEDERSKRIAQLTQQIKEIEAQPYSAARDRVLVTLNKSLAALQDG